MNRKTLSEVHSIFIDTAPFIYFVEGHLEFGQRIKAIFDYFYNNNLPMYSSVITLTEVLSKPFRVE